MKSPFVSTGNSRAVVGGFDTDGIFDSCFGVRFDQINLPKTRHVLFLVSIAAKHNYTLLMSSLPDHQATQL